MTKAVVVAQMRLSSIRRMFIPGTLQLSETGTRMIGRIRPGALWEMQKQKGQPLRFLPESTPAPLEPEMSPIWTTAAVIGVALLLLAIGSTLANLDGAFFL